MLSSPSNTGQLTLWGLLQAVSLVFERVAAVCGIARPAGQGSARARVYSPSEADAAAEAASARSSEDGRPSSAHGCIKAALKLLDDLCMMATGTHSEPCTTPVSASLLSC